MSRYTKNHKLAKLIVCFIVTALMLLNREYNVIYLDVAAVIVWFWGVNFSAYIIEAVQGVEHEHDKL